MESLKDWVRTSGPAYLERPNITSVGIGYKEVAGQRTDEIAIQFTVGQKVSLESLADAGLPAIPDSIEIDGVSVPTDVVQRTFTVEYRLVPEVIASQRKLRLDPVLPGASVAHVRETAGTVGCIVYDAADGTPYILSNWHVLHGPTGRIGDDVVQPGPFDDNRTHLNRLGRLVRSHVGPAGDCAIASIEDRAWQPTIIDLGVAVEGLGEPELGDPVVKSGRTTAVTRGIVTRIHTVTAIDYEDGTGDKVVGGFEIGIDPANVPGDGEISKGGDSGAVWLFTSGTGEPTTVMAGLHFAGEAEGQPHEHALACYPKSVFEKLGITLAPPTATEIVPFGYDPDFLARRVRVPRLLAATKREAATLDGSEVIPYTHFSLALHTERTFAIWVAWNIDGNGLRQLSRKGIPFTLDGRLPDDVQSGDELYRDNPLDRGHLARRADLLWGPEPEAIRANIDSFFFTNIAPQMDSFNQSRRGGLWGRLEDALFEDVDIDDLRVSVFAGPVFQDDDRLFRGVGIPREYWKAIAWVEAGDLRAAAFLLTQNLNQLEALGLDEFRTWQVALTEIETRCGFRFPDNLKAADSFAARITPETIGDRPPLERQSDITWA
jgi:endonuclease G